LNRPLVPLQLKGSGYDEFITALETIALTVCESGARQMLAAGKSPGDFDSDDDARQQFIAAFHTGFAQAQSAIIRRYAYAVLSRRQCDACASLERATVGDQEFLW